MSLRLVASRVQAGSDFSSVYGGAFQAYSGCVAWPDVVLTGAGEMVLHIVSHHVGGRGFGVALNCPVKFSNDIVHVLYEADPDCAAEMMNSNDRRNIKVMPYCLGQQDGRATLKITKNAYFSSLLDAEPEFMDSSCEIDLSGEIDGVSVENTWYDVLYRKEMEVVRQVPVSIRSLDSLMKERLGSQDLAPDFLSLDTQGTEFEIMRGAAETISRHALGIATEIEFTPIYAGQKLFSAFLDFCRDQGFHFAGFTYLQDVLPRRVPVGLRSRGFLAFGDCVFLRRIDSLRSACKSEAEFSIKGRKLAFIAAAFGYLPYCLQVLDEVMPIATTAELREQLNHFAYNQFLTSLYAIAQATPHRFLHDDRYALAAERRNSRRAQGSPQENGTSDAPLDRQHGLLELRVLRYWAIRWLQSGSPMAASLNRWRHRLLRRDNATMIAGERKFSPPQSCRTSDVERLLESFGFLAIANEVRRRRLIGEANLPGAI